MKIPDIAIGAIIGALIAATVALLTILLKDYLIPILTERRTAKGRRKETFRRYASPIIIASKSLLFRIKEVFRRGNFLLANAPKNDFNEYKFISTLYRLCALIGWIQASKIELSFIEVEKNEDFKKIELALEQFEKSLADGHHVEQSVLEQICVLCNISLDKVSLDKKKKIAIEIENKINESCCRESVSITEDLSDEQKSSLVSEVCNLICLNINCALIPSQVLKEKVQTIAKEMSRVEAFLYRDWQSAIGDLMLKKADKDSNRKFEVIGYKDFETLYFSEDKEIIKWIKRVKKLFYNLDISIDNRFDDRINQLRKVYAATYEILKTFSLINKGRVDISQSAIENLKNL